jgi:hypothetical protein
VGVWQVSHWAAVLGAVGMLSVGAILWTVIPHHSSGGGGLDLDAAAEPTAVNITPSAMPSDTGAPTLDPNIAPLARSRSPGDSTDRTQNVWKDRDRATEATHRTSAWFASHVTPGSRVSARCVPA